MDRDVRVLAVDDQEVFLRACARLVAATKGFSWVGGATSGGEALHRVQDAAPDLVLVDVRMPGMDGLETTRRLIDRAAGLVIILISVEPASNLPAGLQESGAAAHVSKHALSPETLRRLWLQYGSSRVTG